MMFLANFFIIGYAYEPSATRTFIPNNLENTINHMEGIASHVSKLEEFVDYKNSKLNPTQLKCSKFFVSSNFFFYGIFIWFLHKML